MPQPEERGRALPSSWPFLFLLLSAALAAATLLRFPPAQFSFYPPCPIQQLLHIQCPGCGSTRAVAALLHGHITEALRLNALTTCILPFVLVYLVRSLIRPPRSTVALPPALLYLSFAVIAVFTILRNL